MTQPTNIFSAGSGDDFTYEDFILSSFPNSSVVVADCFTKPDAQAHGKSYGERVLYVHLCISGAMEGHVAHLSADLQERFVTLPAFMERVQKQRPQIDTFHLYKVPQYQSDADTLFILYSCTHCVGCSLHPALR